MSDEFISDESLLQLFRDMANPDKFADAWQSLELIASDCFPAFFRLIETSQTIEDQKQIISYICQLEKDALTSHPDTFAFLINFALKTENMGLREFCFLRMFSLLDHPTDRNMPIEMLSLLFDENYKVRYFMAHLAGQARALKAVPHLILLLDDSESSVRSAAAETLRRFATPEALIALAQWKRE